MASRINLSFFIVVFLALPAYGQTKNQVSPEVPDPAAVNAFRQYWHSFEAYEQKLLRDGKLKYQEAWHKIKKDHKDKQAKLNAQRIEGLKTAAEKYQKHLRELPSAQNRPLVMLNLAQIQNMLGDLVAVEDANAGVFNKKEALNLLKEIESNFPNFAYREEALYLRGLILEGLDRTSDAQVVWRRLSRISRTTLHGVHANIAVGDHLFERDNPKEAVTYYENGLGILQNLTKVDVNYEETRLFYRLAWSSYRAAHLKKAVKYGGLLLSPGRSQRSIENRDKIQKDAVDLVGNALYEANDVRDTKKVLQRKEIKQFAPAIGLRVMRKYTATKANRKVTDVGEFLVKEFPTTREVPDYLNLLAASYKDLGQKRKFVGALERLAMILPKQSLWRSYYKDDFRTIAAMEGKAVNASRLAAASHYEKGMASGNANSYMAAAALYESLLEHDPNGKKSNRWRLKHAHCHYFSDRLEDAAKLYADLKHNYKLKPETLEIASYQFVLTREKQWRHAYAKASTRGSNPGVDPIAIEHLRKLESATEEFANRFPGKNRSVDLILVVASANRDHERYNEANKYWERAFVSNPSHSQRAIAIRGMVTAAMQSNATPEVIALAKRFIRLEDWNAMGLSLGEELHGVLSSATLDEGKALNKSGKVREAGTLMVKVAQEFKSIPKRDKIYRDGAYMLAIAGDWASAQEAANAYNKAGLKGNRGDIAYLLGRSHEFQIRFDDAAKTYLELGRKYPKHPRALSSLKRSQNLALAENDYETAAAAAELYGDKVKKRSERLASYGAAMDYYDRAVEPEKALKVAQKRKRTSTTRSDVLGSDLMLAKAMYETGNQTKALVAYENVAKRSRSQRTKLGKANYSSLAGESNFLLGEESKEQFDDFDIFERGGSLGKNINQKTKYFEKMVRNYDRAAAANHPEWSPRARYQLAVSAENFADEVASIPLKRGKGLTDRARKKYQATAERLRKLAKRYYSSNLMAKNKNPQLYKNNAWINKSAIKLTGYGDIDYRPEHEYQLPSADHLEMPYQWSL